jgi:glycosyltransferase involved in cell wall biosynthesis
VSKPRICIVISTFYPLVGGAETQVLAQGRSLRERGYDATIVTLRHKKSWPVQDTVERVPVLRVAGKLLNGRERLPKPLQQLLYMLALAVLGWTLWSLRRQYDVLHVHQLSLLTLPAAQVCRFTGKPMLVTLHSAGSGKTTTEDGPASLIAGPLDPDLPWLRIDRQSWTDGDLEGLIRLGRPGLRSARFLLRSVQATIVILSSRMKLYLAAHDLLLPDIHIIPNSVDIERYRPLCGTAGEGEQRTHTVVCISKLRYEKGIDVLLQAWHLVQQQMPEARLIIVGSGPLHQTLTHMAQALSITGSVEFAGLHSDVPAQLHRGAIAVLPSRWEGMPSAVLEAMACGLPCVATRVSGSEDIIQPGVNGLLVEPEDYESMAKALLTLLHDPTLARQYGQAARVTIENHYSLDHVIDAYINLYHKIAD